MKCRCKNHFIRKNLFLIVNRVPKNQLKIHFFSSQKYPHNKKWVEFQKKVNFGEQILQKISLFSLLFWDFGSQF